MLVLVFVFSSLSSSQIKILVYKINIKLTSFTLTYQKLKQFFLQNINQYTIKYFSKAFLSQFIIIISMPHRQIQKLLFYTVKFLKRTSYHHKKKLIALVAIALLSYIAKKKLQFAHLIYAFQKITQVISYLPLPTFPQFRKLNRYQSVNLRPLVNEVISSMNVEAIKSKIKQKKSDWNELKLSIMTGTILSMILFNVQSFYFIIQNKYQSDFRQLNSVETFQKMMGQIRKKFVDEIPAIKQILSNLLYNEIQKIDIKTQYSLEDYFGFIDELVQKVFSGKYLLLKEETQLLQNSFYRGQESFKIAQNYFLTPLQYIHKEKSFFDKVISTVSKVTSKLSFQLFKDPVCQISQQRFEWSRTAYRIPLKKSLVGKLQWPNKQSQYLSKLVINQIDQVIGSLNFSTLLYQNAIYNSKILKNRLFLYFSKNGFKQLRAAQSLTVFYKLIKQEILISSPQSSSNQNYQSNNEQEDRRERFYEMQILKAIKYKKVSESKISEENQTHTLLIREQTVDGQTITQNVKLSQHLDQQMSQALQDQNPELILLNMHLDQILQSKKLSYLVKQFQVKYFNQRSKIIINPAPLKSEKGQRAGGQEDEMRRLLNLLGDNEELNKKD